MAQLEQPNVVGNFLSNYYTAQQKQQADQDRTRTMQRQDVQDRQAQQEHDWADLNRKNEIIARTAMSLTTPEAWDQAVPKVMQQLGLQGPPPSFAERENIINQAMSVKEQLAQKLEAQKFALDERQTNAQINASNAQAEAARALASQRSGGGAGSIDNTTFDNMSGLRREFTQATKTYGDVRDAYGRIKASASNPSAAGDLSLIFNYMKVLDPGSTVREGEFATAQNATGVPERIVNAYNQAINGQRLNPEQRKDFVNRAGLLFQRQHQTYLATKNNYDTLATRFGFDPSLITFDQSGGIQGPQEEAAPAAPPSFTRGGAGVFSQGLGGQSSAPPAGNIPPPPPGARIIR